MTTARFAIADELPVAGVPTWVSACALDTAHVLAAVHSDGRDRMPPPAGIFVWTAGRWSPGPQPPAHVTWMNDIVGIGGGRAVALSTAPGGIGPERAGDPDRNVVTPWLFDLSSASWTEGPSCDLGRRFFQLVALRDGSVLVVGGRGARASSRVDHYDPRTGTWRRTVDLPAPRVGHSATVLVDGRVLLAGGHGTDGLSATGNQHTFVYEPDSDRWTRVGDLKEWRSSHAVTRLQDGRIALFGGSAALRRRRSVEIFDPISLQWAWGKVLANARDAAAATVLAGGSVLISGGVHHRGGDAPSETLATTELWDPATCTTSDGPALCVARHGHRVFALDSARHLVVGGGLGRTRLTCELLAE